MNTRAFLSRTLAGSGILSLLLFGIATADEHGDMGGKSTTTVIQ